MKLAESPSSIEMDSPKFDLLRARLEAEIERPAVIAITSSIAEDGNEVAAWGLACSLAATGYPTIFMDTSLSAPTMTEPAQRLRLDEIANQLDPSQGSASFAVLTLGDPTLQKRTSQRSIVSSFQVLRTKFDYVIINAGFALSSSFATAVVTAADSVLVAVKIGRRQLGHDLQLSAALEQLGAHFLGVIAMDASVIENAPTMAATPASIPDRRLRQAAQADREPQRREVAEWPT